MTHEPFKKQLFGTGGWFRVVSLVLAAGCAVMTILVLVALPWRIHERLIAAMTFVLPAAFFVRMARIGAWFLPQKLRVVRSYRTVSIPWDQVDRFIVRPRGLQPLTIFARLEDGTLVWIEGIGPSFRFATTSEPLDSIVREMNRELDRIRVRIPPEEVGQ